MGRISTALAVLALLGAAWPGLADVSLEVSVDFTTGTSRVLIVGTDDEIIVFHDWPESLPVGYDNEEGEAYFPTIIIGHLRDGSGASGHAEAGTARLWMEHLMGSLASTPTAEIADTSMTSVELDLGRGYAEWCGAGLTSDRRCPLNCDGVDTKRCVGCACRGTRTFE